MSSLEKTFELSKRGSTVRQEIIAGLTTFLAMVYSVIVVPKMLGDAGFPAESVFIATCLVAGFGSILIGFWANAPMAIGCAISLTAFTAFSLVIGQHVSIPVALGAVFLMGLVFTLISATGIRSWILRNLPSSIAHGAGIGIGLFLLLIAANGVGLVVGNQAGLPVKLGDFTSFPVMMSLIGLAFIIGLEKMKVKGGILWVIIAITIVGLIFDPNVTFNGQIFKMPTFGENSLFLQLDLQGALQPAILPIVFALVMTAVFDATGIRSWILRNLPSSIAHGAGIGIGLFLLLIAANGVGLVVGNQAGLPVKLGDFTSFPVMMSLIGLAFIIGLEKMKVKGGILWVIIAITIVGLIFDPNVTFNGQIFKMPTFGENSLFLQLDLQGALQPAILPIVFALVMTAVFDATGTIRAVAGQADLLDKDGQIINGGKALTSDSVSSLFSGLFGTAPAAVYIESAAGTAAGGKTGITAIVVGVLFLLMLFFQPLAFLVPGYATAPALMYVGLLMLSNVTKLDFDDFVGAMSGLVCAVFIVLTANIVTGIMLGFAALVIGRIVSGDVKKLNIGTIIIAIVLVAFYAGGWAI